ncbi:MAG: hypothetical protein LC747_08440, partial [Acidobacteria bacterium]|nr:hypothetical protein [Acidobacteriota bacterium]
MSTEIQQNSAAKSSVPQGLDVGRLEKELAASWQNAGGTEESGVTRVCVLNLIVYATQDEERAKIDALLNEVISHTPSRALVLIANRTSTEAKLKAKVSSLCQE